MSCHNCHQHCCHWSIILVDIITRTFPFKQTLRHPVACQQSYLLPHRICQVIMVLMMMLIMKMMPTMMLIMMLITILMMVVMMMKLQLPTIFETVLGMHLLLGQLGQSQWINDVQATLHHSTLSSVSAAVTPKRLCPEMK